MNIQKIITMYNIILNRKSFTLKTITDLCDIPKRTVYRYLNQFSEANIPIYFDYNIKAYRLNWEFKQNLVNFTLDEKLLIIIGLKYLADSVNDIYENKIDKLILKLISSQEHKIEKYLKMINTYIPSMKYSGDNSNFISFLLLNAAIHENKKIMVKNKTDNSTISIHNPAIQFNGEWHLINKQDLENDRILSDINILNII